MKLQQKNVLKLQSTNDSEFQTGDAPKARSAFPLEFQTGDAPKSRSASPSELQAGGALALQPPKLPGFARQTPFKPLAFILLLPALLLLAILVFFGQLAWYLCHPHIAALQSDPMKSAGLPFEDIQFRSANNGSLLSGWYMPALDRDISDQPSRKTVIFSHGYGGNREEPWVPIYDLAAAVHSRNYNVLMFDYGYVSPKRNRPVTAGLAESKELLGAVSYAKSRDAAEIIVWGFSMGAGTALQAALQSPGDIAGMILDSTFLLEPDAIADYLRRKLDLPPAPALFFLRPMLSVLSGVNLKQIPYEAAKTTAYPMPLFVIHGMKDDKAPYPIAEEIASHQTDPLSRLWLAPKRGHEMIYKNQPEMYLNKTMSFLEQVSAVRNEYAVQ